MSVVVPETAELSRVVDVLTAIRDDLSPHDSCGLSQRQASYTIQTALAMQLLNGRRGRYEITPLGHELLGAHADGSASRVFRTAIGKMALVRDVVPNLLDDSLSVAELAETLIENDRVKLSRSTATKRAGALVSWRSQLQEGASKGGTGPLLLIHLSDIHMKEQPLANNPVADRGPARQRRPTADPVFGAFVIQDAAS